ncbi:hypothetical protein [Christiangramia sp. SM2212]|uniref:DUF4412 domain-containing protein n=1 Tax=Christiangramia sediminicola TaxID=3073267 RepID=A0ABU1EU24_9FLAO|nr:hypothetical protein [Christiangramia sp. SM2212]MDR5591673.1 hypothetical protein [Christiangramia sp. SM2212]
MKNIILIILVFVCCSSFSQSFEGTITYKTKLLNPNPEMILQETWDAQMKSSLGDKGYMLQKYFYKKENYISEITAGGEEGYQLYNPKDKLLYAWQKGSGQAVTINSTVYPDEIIEVEHLKEKETVLNIECNIVVIKSKAGTMKLWYNKKYLKMDASFYQGHIYGHWERILEEIECLPLKVEQRGYMSHAVQTALSFEEQEVDDSKFKLPTFTNIISN